MPEERRPVRPPKEATLDVLEFDSHGTARADFDGRPVEVEHGIPGERVEALVYGKRRRWAKITSIKSPSVDRVEARCEHFHVGCGGCQWQMLSYDSQVSRKHERAVAAFREFGLSLDVSEPVRMDDPWRYRRTVGLSLGHAVGFRRHGSQSIVGVRDCPISHPLIGALAADLNQALASSSINNYLGDVAIEVRVVDCESGPGLHTCIIPSPGSKFAHVEDVMPLALRLAKFPGMVGVLYRHRQEPPQLLYGEPFGWVKLAGAEFAVSAATFFQTNPVLLADLLGAVQEASGVSADDVVVDIYGGAGVFGLRLAPLVRRVLEIEIDPVGVEAAKRSAERQGISNVDFLSGTAESVLDQVGPADAVLVDPPRSGLTPKVLEAVIRMRPRRILYVSCLAGSMARDAAILLDNGYSMNSVRTYDFYPQTYHLELFGVLNKP